MRMRCTTTAIDIAPEFFAFVAAAVMSSDMTTAAETVNARIQAMGIDWRNLHVHPGRRSLKWFHNGGSTSPANAARVLLGKGAR